MRSIALSAEAAHPRLRVSLGDGRGQCRGGVPNGKERRVKVMAEVLDAGVALVKLRAAVIHAREGGQDGDLAIKPGGVLLARVPMQCFRGRQHPRLEAGPQGRHQ